MNLKIKIISFLTFIIVRVLATTYRFKISNPEKLQTLKATTPPPHYIYAIWHQNLIGAIFSEIGNPHAVIVSGSKDGELVAVTCERLGNKTARGSSNRGGVEAMKAMIRLLKAGLPGAITIDGPKGPKHEAKKGIFEISRLTNIPILPYIVYPEKYWVIKKSWDEFRIPKPFTKIYLSYGEPIFVDRSDQSEILDQYASVLKSQLLEGEKKLINLIRH